MDKERNSIIISRIFVLIKIFLYERNRGFPLSQPVLLLAIFVFSFILITPIPFAATQMGTPFLEEEIQAIEEIIQDMQDQLNNLHVVWVNVTGKPLGFANETNTGGIFQESASTVGEPCNAGDVVTWSGLQWVCLQISSLWEDIQNKPSGFADNIDNDTLSEIAISCQINQIAKWNGTHWVCADETTGSSVNTEFIITIVAPSDVTKIFPEKEVIKKFKITGLPPDTIEYTIPIDLIHLETNMGAIGTFEILLEESSDGVNFSRFFFIGVADSDPIYRSFNNLQANKVLIIIEAGDTEKFFRLIGRTFGTSPTGSFDNLKFVMSVHLPEGATIEEIP